MLIYKSKNLTFFTLRILNNSGTSFFDMGISTGFPTPADDFKE